MKKGIIVELKNGLILFCIIYSIVTLASSILQLIQGQSTDTNIHLINRGAVTFIGVITFMLFLKIRLKNVVLSYLLPYAISMGIVFLYVWILGFFEELHPNAYRDIFLNFTVVTICVATVITVIERIRARSSPSANR